MDQTSWIDVNLTKLDANLAALRELLAPPESPEPPESPPPATPAGAKRQRPPMICGVVKADAYGLGATLIAQRLVSRRIDMLAVFSHQQAADLLRVSLDTPILVMSPVRDLTRTDPLYRAAVTGRLHLSVHDPQQVDHLNKIGQAFGCRLPVHLFLDTGMSRSGLNPAQLASVLPRILGMRNLRLAGLYTHLASADNNPEQAHQQAGRIDKALADHRGVWPDDLIVHLANTFATVRHRAFHRDMVRVGLGLYGYGPDLLETGSIIGHIARLQPIARWRSRINHLQRYPKGSLVGYSGSFRLERESLLGVVPAGYADGYPLSLSDKGTVGLPKAPAEAQPATAPVRGRVNMDQIVIDLTDIPAGPWLRVGTMVDLISDDPASPCSLPRLAKLAGSSCYEMLTRLSPRLVRQPIYLAESAGK